MLFRRINNSKIFAMAFLMLLLTGCVGPSIVREREQFALVNAISVDPNIKMPNYLTTAGLIIKGPPISSYVAWLKNKGIQVDQMLLSAARQETEQLADVLKKRDSGRVAVLELEVTQYGISKGWGASVLPVVSVIAHLRMGEEVIWEKKGNANGLLLDKGYSFDDAVKTATLRTIFEVGIKEALSDIFPTLEKDLKERKPTAGKA